MSCESMNKEDIWQILEALPEGWRYGRGVKIERELLNRARKIAELAEKEGWHYQSFPGEDGAVLLLLRSGTKSIEIIFEAGGQINVYYLDNDKEYNKETYE